MNIKDQLKYNQEKPAIHKMVSNEKINYTAIGLLKDQWLTKHQTPVPTTLTVLRGAIEFNIMGKKIVLKKMDTYNIPVNVDHKVKGLKKKNVFTLIQEK